MPRASTSGVAIETAPIWGSAASGNPPRDHGFHHGNCPQMRIVRRKASNLSRTKSQSANPSPSGFSMIGIMSEITASRSVQQIRRDVAVSKTEVSMLDPSGHESVGRT